MIVDEAHNIPQVIEDACSFSFDNVTFVRVLAELNNIETKVSNKCSELRQELTEMKNNFKSKKDIEEKE